MKKMVERTQRRRDKEKRKAVWPTTIIRQSLSGSTGAMETHPPLLLLLLKREKWLMPVSTYKVIELYILE